MPGSRLETSVPNGTYLVSANNLSDVTSESTARSNLGLGSAATLTAGTSANNVLQLDGSGKIPSGTLPALVISNTYVESGQVAMLALSADVGDVCVRTDSSESFILQSLPASTLGNWVQLLSPGPIITTVTSANGLSLTGSTLSFSGSSYSPVAGSSSIVTVGTIGAGIWNGTVVAPTYGGTGVNNGSKTITLGGNLTTSGAYNTTLTATAATTVTLPPSGTLATTANLSSYLPIADTTTFGLGDGNVNLKLNYLNSTGNYARISPTSSTDFVWQGGISLALQMSAWHEIRFTGGTTSGSIPSTISGGGSTWNVVIQNANAATIGLMVQGASSQTGNLTEWVNNSLGVLAYVDPSGNATFNNLSAPSGYGLTLNTTGITSVTFPTSGTLVANNQVTAIKGVTVNNNGTVINTGVVGWVQVPFNCTIINVTVTSLDGVSGSIVFDIQSIPESSMPANSGTSIVASDKPTITSGTKVQDTTLTGWTTSLTGGSYLVFIVDSVTSLDYVQIELKLQPL